MTKILLSLTIFFFFHFQLLAQKTTPAILAHSHNDYEQKIPLFKALGHNFQSIEIDIIRDGNQLVVSHDTVGLDKKETIEKLYLKPLKNYLIKNKGKNIWLLIDIKEYDETILDLLHEIIMEYETLFKRRHFLEKEKPLQILLSGDLPRAAIMDNKKYVFFFIDGRISDLGKSYDAELMPLISANFSHHSTWDGKGKMDEQEYLSVLKIIQLVHAENKKIRFWATADKKRMWKTLQDLGVDVIGVDHIGRFGRFMK